MPDENKPSDVPQTSIVTTTSVDPSGPTTQALVTTEPLPTTLRIVMVIVSGVVASIGAISWIAVGASEAGQACFGFAALVFATSNMSIGNALAALPSFFKRSKKTNP